jgi:hypothetical protein
MEELLGLKGDNVLLRTPMKKEYYRSLQLRKKV